MVCDKSQVCVCLTRWLIFLYVFAGKYSVWKDVMLGLSVMLCVVGMAYAVRQRRDTQRRIDTFLESFREKERELRALQEKYVRPFTT